MWFLRRQKNEESSADPDEALAQSQQAYRKIKKRGAEVTDLVQSMREVREVNHFAEKLQAIILRHGGTFNDS